MTSPKRGRLVAGAGLLLALVLAGTWQLLGSAEAEPAPHDLVLGSTDADEPETIEQFLTAVTTDVDSYWTRVFEDSGLPEPRVAYYWIPPGQTAPSACGDGSGSLGDSAAAY